ncbi:hypothetical protein DITRI_Ditri02bG0020400 [Diplodiscus trichospermus]
MASRNQNRPPRNLSTRKELGDENPLDKRRRLGATRRGVGPTGIGRSRQPFAVVNNRQDATTAANAEECRNHEFTKEEVEAILNEKPRAKKIDLKAKYEHAAEYNKRLKLCVKWFQQCDENHVLDKEKLKNSLEFVEKKCIDIELEKKNKEEELNAIISELKGQQCFFKGEAFQGRV